MRVTAVTVYCNNESRKQPVMATFDIYENNILQCCTGVLHQATQTTSNENVDRMFIKKNRPRKKVDRTESEKKS